MNEVDGKKRMTKQRWAMRSKSQRLRRKARIRTMKQSPLRKHPSLPRDQKRWRKMLQRRIAKTSRAMEAARKKKRKWYTLPGAPSKKDMPRTREEICEVKRQKFAAYLAYTIADLVKKTSNEAYKSVEEDAGPGRFQMRGVGGQGRNAE